MKKKMLSVLLVLCMISALAGCGNAEDPGNKPAGNEQEDTGGTQEIIKVGIGVTPYPMYAVLSVAHETGLDKEYGLDLDLQVVSST